MKNTISKYIKYNVEAMRVIGLWTDSDHIFDSKFNRVYYVIVLIFFMTLFNLSLFIYVLTVFGDIEELATAAYVFLISNMGMVKIVFFSRKFSLFKSIIRRLDDEEFQPRNEEQRRETYHNMVLYIWAQIMFTVMFFFLGGLYLSVPLFTSDQENKILPFKAWYPYDFRRPTLYVVSYIHQVIAMVYMSFTSALVDLVTVGMMAYVGAECDILSNTLRNLRGFTRARLEKERACLVKRSGKNLQRDRFSSSDEEEWIAQDMNTTLLLCIQHHWKILKFSEHVNELFSTYVSALFFSTLLALCLTMFNLTVVEIGSGEFYTFVVFGLAVLYELLLYCYFGNVVIDKSDNIAYSLYECEWVDCPKVFRSNMLFFIQRTNLRPIKMMGVKFFILSLPSFTAILRASWSFFAMLHQMHMRN